MDLTLGAALLAGLISFLSPCVLPVVPAYLGQLGIMATANPLPAGTPGLVPVGSSSSATITPLSEFSMPKLRKVT